MFSINYTLARLVGPVAADERRSPSSSTQHLLSVLRSPPAVSSNLLRAAPAQGPFLRLPVAGPRGSFHRTFSPVQFASAMSQHSAQSWSAVTAPEHAPSDRSSPYSEIPSFRPLPSAEDLNESLEELCAVLSCQQRGDGERPPGPYAANKVTISKFIFETATASSLPSEMNKVSFLRNGWRHLYTACESLEQGSYGKYKLAVDEDGNVWGIKVLRHREKLHKKYNGRREEVKRTHVTTREEARGEIDAIGRFSKHLKVNDDFEIDGKRYVVMTAMAGPLDEAVAHICEPAKRRAVARSALKQMGEQLMAMQDEHYIHGDIKAPNTLIDAKGNIALSDFGKVTPLDPEDHDACLPYHRTQTYQAPEKDWGRATEVWALGVTILQLLSRGDKHLYSFRRFTGENIQAFLDWRAELVQKAEALDYFHMRRHINWSDHAAGLAKDDPELFDFVIRHMLNPDPAARASMETVCEKAAAWLRDGEQELAHTALRDAARKMGKDDIVETLRAIAANPPNFSDEEFVEEYEEMPVSAPADALSDLDDDQDMMSARER